MPATKRPLPHAAPIIDPAQVQDQVRYQALCDILKDTKFLRILVKIITDPKFKRPEKAARELFGIIAEMLAYGINPPPDILKLFGKIALEAHRSSRLPDVKHGPGAPPRENKRHLAIAIAFWREMIITKKSAPAARKIAADFVVTSHDVHTYKRAYGDKAKLLAYHARYQDGFGGIIDRRDKANPVLMVDEYTKLLQQVLSKRDSFLADKSP